MSELVFHRRLKRGSAGRDVIAVKRGLARAGYGRLRGITPVFGPFAARHLAKFQADHRLSPSGIYGPHTHRALIPHFDALARKLYEQSSRTPARPVGVPTNPPSAALRLPKDFTPTHQTAGLDGYPAIDVFAAPGTTVLAPEGGRVDKLSGRDPKLGGSPGGAYGWTVYLDCPSGRYFLTHLGSRAVTLGQTVKAGQKIGTVCDSSISGKPGTSHIHEGKRGKPKR